MTVFIFVRIIYLKQKKEETIYDYGPSSNFQGFDFLASYVYLLCILFFFKVKTKEEEPAKKCDSEFTSFVSYFPTRRIEIFSSRFVVKRVVL